VATKFTRDVVEKSTGNVAGDAHLQGAFICEIDNLPAGGVHSYDGVDNESESVESGDADEHYTRLRPGRVKMSTLTLHRDFAGTDDWFNWFKTGLDGKVERKSVAIRFLTDDVNKTGSRTNFYDAWVKKWKLTGLNSKNSGHAQESIEIVYEKIELVAG
jgi:phage tail-like protein